MSLCELPPPPAAALPTRYDAAWPLTKLPLRATPHAVAPMGLGSEVGGGVVGVAVALSSEVRIEDDDAADESGGADG